MLKQIEGSQGVAQAVAEKGPRGLLPGGLPATSGGIAADAYC